MQPHYHPASRVNVNPDPGPVLGIPLHVHTFTASKAQLGPGTTHPAPLAHRCPPPHLCFPPLAPNCFYAFILTV